MQITATVVLNGYLVILALYVATELGLLFLNQRHVRLHSKSVPSVFGGWIEPGVYAKTVAYSLAKGRLAVIDLLYSTALLLAFVLFEWFAEIERVISSLSLPPLTAGVVYILVLGAIFTLAGIPLELWRVFGLEEQFGFNRTTWRLWLKDLVKGWVIGLIFFLPVLYGLLWFMEAAGERWWLYGFGLVFGFQLFLLAVYPVWIAPWFNKFTALADLELVEEISTLARKAGFKTGGIFVMDGSRRSAHSNAYFTGLGKKRRVVLFDTLIELLPRAGLLGVVAHEMGHAARGHLRKSIILSGAVVLAGFFVLSLILNWPAFFEAFGFAAPGNAEALVLFSFASGPVSYFLSPLFSALSRRFEYEADRFAVDLCGGFSALRDALLELSRKNLANLTPHPWYSFFHYSHPVLAERITAMERYGNV